MRSTFTSLKVNESINGLNLVTGFDSKVNSDLLNLATSTNSVKKKKLAPKKSITNFTLKEKEKNLKNIKYKTTSNSKTNINYHSSENDVESSPGLIKEMNESDLSSLENEFTDQSHFKTIENNTKHTELKKQSSMDKIIDFDTACGPLIANMNLKY